ncbi:MAG: DUF6259 domain-containing protein [Planctomycetota bacterium]|nr:DUF6259 domain-containing protein [Planctomycetota bacterium]
MNQLTMLLVGMALWVAALDAVAADKAEVVTLENRVLRLEIEPTPAPFIKRLVHRASGQDVVASSTPQSLFSITLVKEDGSQETIDSLRAGESRVRVERAADATKLVIHYGKFPAVDLAVEVAVVSDEKNPLTFWSLRVENNTGRQIKAVRFPQLLAVPTIGDGKDDCLVLPSLPGVLIENPAENWRNGQSVTLTYPGNLSAQFLAYQNRSAGVYLAGSDPAGYPMSLAIFKQADGFRCWHEFTRVADARNSAGGDSAPGPHWESPYPVALGVTQGTWYDSADLYKQWAVRQPWCAKPLVERDDIPAWWKDGPAVHVLEVRTYDGTRTCTASYYPQLLDHLRTFREQIDGPVVPMLAGWENHRRWTAGDYFPVFDAEHAQPVLAQLKQAGFRPFFFLSGLFSTYRNEGRDGGEIPAAQQHTAAYVVDGKTGKPKEYLLNESNPAGDWKRHSYEFCVSPPQTKEFFCRVVDEAHAVGVDVLQMDQTTNGAGEVCNSTTHGHTPGVGLYQSRAFWDLLDALRQHGKRRSADFVLFHEEPHEQLIPHLDGFHVREYYEKRWYRGYPGAVGIPLFAYLYHEYALGYGGDSAGLSKQNDRWLVRCHAMNLVTGRTPGVSIWSSHRSLAEAHPDQISLIRHHSRLLKTRAKECLLLGRMLHPYELPVPKLVIGVAVQRDGKWVKEDLPTPAILTSSWQSPTGKIGHLFVNIAEARQTLQVSLDTRNTPAGKSYEAELYRSTQGESFRPLWQNLPVPQAFTAELEPLEVVFIEIR